MCEDLQKIAAVPFYPTPRDCRVWSQFINQLTFGGKLPKWKNIRVTNLHRAYAWCEAKDTPSGLPRCHLLIHRKFPSFSTFFMVLAHELIHYAEYVEFRKLTHGKYFQTHKTIFQKYGIRITKLIKE